MDECYKLLDMVYTLIWPQDGSETQKMKFEFSKVNVNLFSENMDHKIELKLEKKKKTAECWTKVYLASRLGTLLGSMDEQWLAHLFNCDPIVLAIDEKKQSINDLSRLYMTCGITGNIPQRWSWCRPSMRRCRWGTCPTLCHLCGKCGCCSG